MCQAILKCFNFILVKAEIVDFVANATTVCQNDLVTFNCSAAGNPAVDTYLLYVNGVVIDSNRFGNWSRSMTTGGVLNFTCVVNNTLGTDTRTVAVTVNGKCRACIVRTYFSSNNEK